MVETLARPITRLRVLLPSMAVLAFAVFVCQAALLSVLLPNQIETLDPANKVANLAVVTTVSFTFTIFSQPLIGALSDRTRHRLGSRMPWVIVGAVVAGGFLVGMGGLATIFLICIFWVVIQFALNAVDVACSAYVPDRFPRARRGLASAVLGLGAVGGGAAGTVVAGRLVGQSPLAYALLGSAVVLVATLFVLVNRDRPTRDDPAPAFSWRVFVRSFWIDPREHPDYAWAFASRFFFILGFNLVYAFTLYVLTDYILLPREEANILIGGLSVVTMVAIVLSVVTVGWWSDRIGRRKVFLVAASVLLMIGLAFPLMLPTVTGMLIFAALKGLAFGVYLSSGGALITEVLPDARAAAAKDLGIFNVATNVPQAIAPTLAAVIIAASGGYAGLFVVAIVGVAVSAVLIARVRSVR